MNINSKLKQLRKQKGISQEEAAQSLGVSLSSYQKYEREKSSVTPSIDVILRIADFYGVSTDYLLGRSPLEALELDISPVDDSEFLRQYMELPDLAKEIFVDVLTKLAQAQKSKSKKAPPKADSAPQLFIAASDGTPVTQMDKGVIDRLKNAKPIDDDF